MQSNVFLLSGEDDTVSKYLYALRLDNDGTLYLNRVDSSKHDSSITLFLGPLTNQNVADKFDLSTGEFYDGRDINSRELVDENLYYEQWRWDSKFISYYINSDGEFVALVGEDRIYPEDV